ncbi:hypothetical protein EMIHUDRAFT_201002 [Emiliania huxleyi CCMP1516]|uniref:Serine/threonine specific protein phosphatases domain-containing protein n=2 Tax=Emiliania huxleyi TaxID=2903 RepID=A0A0D3KLZ8_EMIH1|nr:hypothetical protein EMIHUDRAFT_201002 [Emiliania huxleyi CCMP1516]EOD36783.1 hypothetical protein EMIHUDRAFT_201002 [Emiliania huxleyi CCMP1516]|eukprot:XP_005789212.1 hypothetical protein EMIHUDRAFT_201002 [Emiliania huxleyi CCMP1516]
MWSDPSDSDAIMRSGVHSSFRGECMRASEAIPEFGPDITGEFCTRNNISLVIRSHQFVKEGIA